MTPGVIPKGRPRLASSIGEVIENHLLTKEDIRAHLLTEQIEQRIADTAAEKLSCNIKEEIRTLSHTDEMVYEKKKSELCQAVSVQIVKAIQSSDFTETVLNAAGEALKDKISHAPIRWLVNDRTINAVVQPTKDILDTMIEEQGTELIMPVLETKLSEIDSGSVTPKPNPLKHWDTTGAIGS